MPNWLVSMLLVNGPLLPICLMSLPSVLNFSTILSPLPLPLSQTKPLLSARMPCSCSGQSEPRFSPGPPHDFTISPDWLNTSTDGAGTQHFERGGLSVAPFSSSVSERGRWNTQILSEASTEMPPIWPRIQLFGNGFGQ